MGNARLQKVHGNRMTNARNKTCKTLIIKKQGKNSQSNRMAITRE